VARVGERRPEPPLRLELVARPQPVAAVVGVCRRRADVPGELSRFDVAVDVHGGRFHDPTVVTACTRWRRRGSRHPSTAPPFDRRLSARPFVAATDLISFNLYSSMDDPLGEPRCSHYSLSSSSACCWA